MTAEERQLLKRGDRVLVVDELGYTCRATVDDSPYYVGGGLWTVRLVNRQQRIDVKRIVRVLTTDQE